MSQKNTPHKIIISGGGTGGHIYPALAIANQLKETLPDIDILFVGARGRMEMQKIPEAGYPIKGLWITGIKRKITFDNLLFPIKLLSSILKSRRIIRKFKPHAVIGVGGFASGPLLHVAAQKKIPTLIQEQNSYAGLTNKLLAKKVQKICVAYHGMEKFFPKEKIILTGNPVRKDILNINQKREEALNFFNLSPTKKTVLILGGSLGAASINQSVLQNINLISQESQIQWLWQTGSRYYNTILETVKEQQPENLTILQFIKTMDLAYAAADVVISRAGALSISELCLAKKPVIFVPSPNVAEDHQTKNAMALVNNYAAWIVKDNKTNEKLIQSAISLINNPNECSKLSNNIATLAKPDATEKIVSEIIKFFS